MCTNPSHNGKVAMWCSECFDSLQEKLDAANLQNVELKEACHWIIALTERWTLTAEERITLAKARKAIGEVVEKPKGVCTHNCLDKDYSTGHTLCMKELPCPDHDAKKPVDERACCTCGGAGLRDIGHAPCHSPADRHFCVSCKTTPVSEAGRTCVVCIAHNWPNNDTIKREDVPAPSEECTCDGGFDPNPGCPLHD